jgi:soluble lytic murein transglycosylase-like protein
MKSREAISRITFSLQVILFSVIPLVHSSYADIYSYLDENGIYHYTNMPSTDQRYKLKWRTKKVFVKPSGIYTYSKSYEEEILKAAKHYNIDPDLVKAIIKVESNFNSTAVSQKGAMGIMQLMPETAQDYSVSNPFNPMENIEGGTKYLRNLMETFGGDLQLVLAAYNAGENAVIKYGFRIPPFAETADYVEKVLMHYSHLKGNNDK